jgi:cytochrome c oxidase subunit 3
MAESGAEKRPLPVGAKGIRSSGWWGMCMLIFTEASLFGYLLLSYYYLWTQARQAWPPEGLLRLGLSGANTAILLSSSVFVFLAERGVRGGRIKNAAFWLSAAIAAGGAFIAIQLREWRDKGYGLADNLYGSLYFTITGFHMLHVAAGIAVLAFLLLWTLLGYFDSRRYEAVSIGGLYWHFVDAVWLAIFSTFFLVPYL